MKLWISFFVLALLKSALSVDFAEHINRLEDETAETSAVLSSGRILADCQESPGGSAALAGRLLFCPKPPGFFDGMQFEIYSKFPPLARFIATAESVSPYLPFALAASEEAQQSVWEKFFASYGKLGLDLTCLKTFDPQDTVQEALKAKYIAAAVLGSASPPSKDIAPDLTSERNSILKEAMVWAEKERAFAESLAEMVNPGQAALPEGALPKPAPATQALAGEPSPSFETELGAKIPARTEAGWATGALKASIGIAAGLYLLWLLWRKVRSNAASP